MLESFLDFFLGIHFSNTAEFLLRLILVYLALPYAIFHGLCFALLQMNRAETVPFRVWFHMQLCKAVLILMCLISVHFFFVLRNTSFSNLRWNEFPISKENCYFMFFPNLTAFLVCIMAFWFIQERLKKIIR